MNGKKVSEIGSDIGRIAYKCESLTDIIPSKYRSIEVSTIIREIYDIKQELNSIGNNLETIGELIIKAAKASDNDSNIRNIGEVIGKTTTGPGNIGERNIGEGIGKVAKALTNDINIRNDDSNW